MAENKTKKHQKNIKKTINTNKQKTPENKKHKNKTLTKK